MEDGVVNMATIAPKKRSSNVPSKYLALIHDFPLRPIRTARELNAATEILDRLFASPRLSREEQDYVQVLAGLVERYEEGRDPVDVSNVTPVEMLKHLMEENDMKPADLANLLDIGPSAVSMIFSGKREISKANAKTLAERFIVNVSVFI